MPTLIFKEMCSKCSDKQGKRKGNEKKIKHFCAAAAFFLRRGGVHIAPRCLPVAPRRDSNHKPSTVLTKPKPKVSHFNFSKHHSNTYTR